MVAFFVHVPKHRLGTFVFVGDLLAIGLRLLWNGQLFGLVLVIAFSDDLDADNLIWI